MALRDFVAELERRSQRARDVSVVVFSGATSSQKHLADELRKAESKIVEREVSREARLTAQVDPDHIRRLCGAGRTHELSSLEQKVVVAQFASFGPEVVAAVLRLSPHLRPRYARRLLRDWGVPADGAQWDRLVSAGEFSDEDIGVGSLPLLGAALLEAHAPARLARLLSRADLESVFASLSAAGLKPDGPYVSSCLLAWLESRLATGWTLSDSLRWALKTPSARSQLVPRVRARETKGAVDLRHPLRFTALMLRARRNGALDEAGYEDFVSVVTDPQCEFGDPRVDVSRAWSEIKRQEPAGYQSLVERLNSEDLRFFFDKTMDDAADRREFWLGYLKAIRRTVCVLDRKSAARIKAGLSLQPERLRSAYLRAGQFTGTSEVSAFCLWFDTHVVVEFSKSGNAAYVYTLAQFEKYVKPHLAQPRDETDLKEAEVAKKWNHNENWERRFRDRLSELGIGRGAW